LISDAYQLSQPNRALDTELDRLMQVRNLLIGANTPTRKRRHTLSAAARARISAAQKKRWARQKRAAKGE